MSVGGWEALNSALLKAHDSDDIPALIGLYARATDAAEAAGDVDRAAFFATHAWIFALEAGDARAVGLRARLLNWGKVDEELA